METETFLRFGTLRVERPIKAEPASLKDRVLDWSSVLPYERLGSLEVTLFKVLCGVVTHYGKHKHHGSH